MKRTSIYLSNEIKAVIHQNEKNRSGRLSIVVDRYSEIIKAEFPTGVFTPQEIKLIIESLKGHNLKHAKIIQAIQFYVRDHLLVVNYKANEVLIDKIRSLSFVQCVSLVENIESLILKELK